MRYFNYLVILLAMIFASCEKEMEIDIEDANEKIVLNAILSQEDFVELELTKSFSPFGQLIVKDLDKATVSIYENGSFVENLTYNKLPDKAIGKFLSSFIPNIGNTYKIEVSDPNLGEASSLCIVPNTVNISHESVKWTEWGGAGNGTSFRYNFLFTLEDPGTTDYYYLTMRFPVFLWNETSQQNEFYAYQYAEIITSDLPLHQEYLRNGLLFTDKTYNNSNHIISGTATTYQYPFGDYLPLDGSINENDLSVDFTKLEICVHHLSDDLYLFYTSHATKLQNDHDLYSEPSLIYSNIENGFGIFAGENITLKQVIIEY